jgi:hypothetical protein
MGNYAQARSYAERAASLIEQTGGILDLQVYTLLEQIYRWFGEKELADKYANLTRQTPPPNAQRIGVDATVVNPGRSVFSGRMGLRRPSARSV